ncbi:MAG: hypothetical protein N2738_07545, partial [Thermodesulfovibrionales bacterium]|nr:hypothetical protein [Thermodesulfovibrionales bacterium]
MSNSFRDLIISEAQRILFELKNISTPIEINNLSIPHTAVFLNLLDTNFIIIEEDYEASLRLFQDYLFFKELIQSKKEALFFPVSSNIELIGKRIEAMWQYLNSPDCNLITSIEAINDSLDIFTLDEALIHIDLQKEIERDALKSWLLSNGYREVSMVVDKGEFSQRSYIFDIFPCTNQEPVRIEFFGDEVDSIRTIDIESQRSVN